MTIITNRTCEKGNISFNYELCNSCGLCVKICKDFSLVIQNNRPVENINPLFGCIACGHCMAICPTNAIKITGRDLSPDDVSDYSKYGKSTDYESLESLFLKRRSIRDFKDMEIDDNLCQKIIEAASTAPMGIPPTDVKILVIKGKEKVREFSFDVIDYFHKNRWLFSKNTLWIWRLWGEETYDLMKTFINPMLKFFKETKDKDQNLLLYDAPMVMYFTGSAVSDPADSYIAATYAMIAAESLGIGSCMIGSIHPMISYGAKNLKKKWQLPIKSSGGIFIVFGFPKYKFKSVIKRSFASVTYIK